MPIKVLRSVFVVVAVSILCASTTLAQRVPEGIYKEGYEALKKLFSQAVVAGDLAICKELLEKNAVYINEPDDTGLTQLHYAAMSGQAALCRLFLQHGARADIPRKEGKGIYFTPLEAAIANDHTAAALVLIEAIAPESLAPIRGRNQPPLFLAIQNENIEIIKALIAKKADVNMPDKIGERVLTPFAAAVSIDNREIAKILLEAGADLRFDQEDIRTADALFTAVMCRNYDMCSFLVESKIDVNVKNYYGHTVLHVLLGQPMVSLSYINKNSFGKEWGQSFAVTGPYKQVRSLYDDFLEEEKARLPEFKANRFIKLFIDAGTDVNVRDESDCSVLETLFLSQIEEPRDFAEFRELLELLIAAKVDMTAADEKGWTPLYYLLFSCFLDTSLYEEEKLDEAKIKEIADKKTALFKLLIDAGAKVKTADKRGNTLLHYVVRCPFDSIDKGEFNIELMYDSRGFHRLFSRQLIELLLEHGLTLSDENNDGETPLDWATGGGMAGHPSGGYGSSMGGGYYGGMGGGYGGATPAAPIIVPPSPGASPAGQLGF